MHDHTAKPYRSPPSVVRPFVRPFEREITLVCLQPHSLSVGHGWLSAWLALLISCKVGNLQPRSSAFLHPQTLTILLPQLMAAQLGLEPDIVKPADINDSFRCVHSLHSDSPCSLRICNTHHDWSPHDHTCACTRNHSYPHPTHTHTPTRPRTHAHTPTHKSWFPRADDATSTGTKNAPAALQPSQPAPPLALEANPFERRDMA